MSRYTDHSDIPAERNFTEILGPDGYVSYETILEMLNATKAEREPRVGDVVLYNHPGDATGTFGRKQSPAIVTYVHGESIEEGYPWVVDLFVLTAPTWVYDEDGTGRCVAGGGTYHNLKCVQGDGPLQWTWRD